MRWLGKVCVPCRTCSNSRRRTFPIAPACWCVETLLCLQGRVDQQDVDAGTAITRGAGHGLEDETVGRRPLPVQPLRLGTPRAPATACGASARPAGWPVPAPGA